MMPRKDNRPRSTNRSLRKLFAFLFAVTVLVALYGWMNDKDPNQLSIVMTALTLALGIGEGSNIGRRMTYKAEAVTPREDT